MLKLLLLSLEFEFIVQYIYLLVKVEFYLFLRKVIYLQFNTLQKLYNLEIYFTQQASVTTCGHTLSEKAMKEHSLIKMG